MGEIYGGGGCLERGRGIPSHLGTNHPEPRLNAGLAANLHSADSSKSHPTFSGAMDTQI